MKINNPKIFWTIIVVILFVAALIATKITGYDIDNPDDSKNFITTLLFVVIFGAIFFLLWTIPKKK